MLAPEGALNIHEKAWNAYPYCRTGEYRAEMWTQGGQKWIVRLEAGWARALCLLFRISQWRDEGGSLKEAP